MVWSLCSTKAANFLHVVFMSSVWSYKPDYISTVLVGSGAIYAKIDSLSQQFRGIVSSILRFATNEGIVYTKNIQNITKIFNLR